MTKGAAFAQDPGVLASMASWKMAAAVGLGLGLAASGCSCDETFVGLRGALEVEPEALDFGKVPVGGQAERTLTLRNSGNFTLKVEGFQAALPFVAPDVATATIGTGLTREVTVRFRPTAVGEAAGALSITTDERDVVPLEVPLTGEGIEAAVRVEPLVVDFGEVLWVANTERRTAEVTITNPGTDSFDLTQVELTEGAAGAFGLDVRDVIRTFGPGDTGTLQVSYLPVAMGAAQGSVRIATTAPTAPEVVVTLLGTAVGPVMEVCAGVVTGAELCTAAGQVPTVDFGPVPIGTMGSGAIRILNVGDRDLIVQGQLLGAPGEIVFSPAFDALGQFTVAPGGEQRVDTTYAPQDYQFDAVNVALGANAAQRPSQVVAVRGEVPKPKVEVIPRSLTFRVQGGVTMAQAPVKVINCGTLDLSVQQTVTITQTGGPSANAFMLTSPITAGTTVPPSGGCTQADPGPQFNVVFAPGTPGQYSATIDIVTNDPNEPSVTVQILGTKS
jgi:hypothetical protein